MTASQTRQQEMEELPGHIVIKRSVFSKFVVAIGVMLGMLIGLYGLADGVASRDMWTSFLGVFAAGCGLLFLVSLFRYRIEVNDQGINKIDITQQSISWDEVSEIRYYGKNIVVCGEGSKIELARDIGDRRIILKTILSRIDKERVRLTGPGWSGGREAPG